MMLGTTNIKKNISNVVKLGIEISFSQDERVIR
jgi:hypothetical protein